MCRYRPNPTLRRLSSQRAGRGLPGSGAAAFWGAEKIYKTYTVSIIKGFAFWCKKEYTNHYTLISQMQKEAV